MGYLKKIVNFFFEKKGKIISKNQNQRFYTISEILLQFKSFQITILSENDSTRVLTRNRYLKTYNL
jgi:hypothetical protein